MTYFKVNDITMKKNVDVEVIIKWKIFWKDNLQKNKKLIALSPSTPFNFFGSYTSFWER
jgi:hypothetical protein